MTDELQTELRGMNFSRWTVAVHESIGSKADDIHRSVTITVWRKHGSGKVFHATNEADAMFAVRQWKLANEK